MDWTELIAWIGWGLTGIAWGGPILYRRWRPLTPPHDPKPGRVIELRNAHNQVESLRRWWRSEAPPASLFRPHGKHAATTYRYVGEDGDRFVYRADL